MKPFDHVRSELAVQRYDFWLDLRGVPRRRRRDLRRELRANLADAASHSSIGEALVGIGSPRSLAHDMAEVTASRPRWSAGVLCALVVLMVLGLAWMFSLVGFLEGVQASGVTGRDVSGSVFPWLGEVSARVEPGGSGLSVSGILPVTVWGPALLVLLLVARPWRGVPVRSTSRRAQRWGRRQHG